MNNTSCTPARAHGNEVFDQRGRVPSPRTVCLASLAPPKHSSEGSCTERSKKSSCKEFMPVAFASHMPWLDLPTSKPCQRRAVGFFYLLDTGSEMQRQQKPRKKRVCRTFYCGQRGGRTDHPLLPVGTKPHLSAGIWGTSSVLLPPKHTCCKKKSCKYKRALTPTSSPPCELTELLCFLLFSSWISLKHHGAQKRGRKLHV